MERPQAIDAFHYVYPTKEPHGRKRVNSMLSSGWEIVGVFQDTGTDGNPCPVVIMLHPQLDPKGKE